MLVFEADRSQPGTHALVIGVSRYPHLPGGDGAPATNHFGLTQLGSAARSAHHFAEWLIHEARLPVPLGSCRVMLAPSPEEAQAPEIQARSGGCSASDFLEEANDWIADASRSPEESTIFYFVGQKLHSPGSEDLLLFEDFGAPRGPVFKGGVSFMNIFQGMGSNASLSSQVQHFFIDGSRHSVDESMGGFLRGTTDVFDVRPSQVDRRAGGTFHAAVPGGQAYAHVDGVSLFLETLLKGLRGGAAVRPRDGRGWAVTAGSLATWLGSESRAESERFGVALQYELSIRGDATVCTLDKPPSVPVSITLEPPEAMMEAWLKVVSDDGTSVHAARFDGPSMDFDLPAGVYEFEIVPHWNWQRLRKLAVVSSPGLRQVFTVRAQEATP
ncbi:MAG: hypothetical protein ABI699_14795 [Caldimonas sp.]